MQRILDTALTVIGTLIAICLALIILAGLVCLMYVVGQWVLRVI